jgi:hypothetical protein
MAYGKNKGRFRGIRVGRFDPNMGAAEVAVKSTDVDGALGDSDLISNKLWDTSYSCALWACINHEYTILDTAGGGRTPKSGETVISH